MEINHLSHLDQSQINYPYFVHDPNIHCALKFGTLPVFHIERPDVRPNVADRGAGSISARCIHSSFGCV